MLAAGLRVALGPSLFLACGAAFAQAGGSIAFLSDYRYRGVSLSDERPTLQPERRLRRSERLVRRRIAHGRDAGPVRPARSCRCSATRGYAGRLSERLGWEAGATGVHFGVDSRYDYWRGLRRA